MSTSSFDIRQELSALPFWKDLAEEERSAILNCSQIRAYRQGELIYAKDQECLGLIRVLRGAVRTFMLSEEGREIRLYGIGAGDTDVLSAACVMNEITFETQMVADQDTELLVVPAVCLSKFKQSNVFVRCFLFEKLGQRFSDAMHAMQAILFTRVDQRLAATLLQQAGGTGRLRATHEQLAKEINTAREVVSRTLKEMERQGLIRLGRGRIELTSLPGLRRLADTGSGVRGIVRQ